MMKKSPIFPKSETGDYNEHRFDPQVDFSQFLEEAINHATNENVCSIECVRSREEKSKKSWKNSLFSWWKVDKKKNKKKTPPMGSSSNPHILNSRRGSVSGQIYGSGRKACQEHLVRCPNSGPLTGFFTPLSREEASVPYVSLDQLNHPTTDHPQAYGPVYMVT